ncbi:MAG TPA: hypothetical protein VK572_00285 [Burkholderiales bacterium]|nr:hypothetical protein [Burkholderiales bacterium]
MLGWACATPVHAGESGFGIGLSLAHDSNIAYVETNPQSDWTQTLMAGLFYQENTVDVTAHVLAQVERRHFLNHSFSDDTGGFLDGAAVWSIVPRKFTWSVEDTFREVQVAITSPSTPSNLSKSNALNTGPDFTFALSSLNSAVIGGRYGRFDIQDSNIDNHRYMAYVRGVHALSPQTKVSLNYETTHTYFEPGAAFTKVLRQDVFARYDMHSGLNGLTVDLGATRLAPYGSPEVTGRLARLGLSQALSSQSALRLALSDQISDTASDLIAGVTSSTAPSEAPAVALNVNTFASGDLYHSKRGEISYANDDRRLAYTFQLYGRRVDFETLDQDYQEGGGAFQWSWVFSGAMKFNAFATYAKRTFDSLDRQDTDRNTGVGMAFRLNSNVSFLVQGGRLERQSTAPASSFVDNRILLLLGYSAGPFEVRSRR